MDSNIDNDMYVYCGDEVKAVGDGKVAGYLVRFGGPADTDLEGEYFTAATDFGELETPRVLYHHGQDVKVGKRKIGQGRITRDEVGLWVEAQLQMRDEYERAIYDLVQQGRLDWSSGAAGHLVERKRNGKSVEITSWPIVEASLTPKPAEPRNRAVALKSLMADVADTLETGSTRDVVDTSQTTPDTDITRDYIMSDTDIKAAVEAVLAEQAAAKAAEEARKRELEQAREEGRRAGIEEAKMARGSIDGFNVVNPANLGSDALREMDALLRDRREIKTLTTSETDTPKAGYLVAPQWHQQLVELLGVQSIMRASGAQVQPNFVGEVYKIPYESTGSTASTVAENAAIAASEPVFGNREIKPYKPAYTILVTNETLENTSYNLLEYVQRRAAKAIAGWENDNFLVGNGTSAPRGAVTAATSVNAAAAATISEGDIIDLLYELDGDYSANGVFVMSKATLAAVRKLTGNNFLFNVTPLGGGTAAGNGGVYFAETINGRRVHTSSAMDDIGANKHSIVFFDPREYMIVDWRNLTIMVDPYSHADEDKTRIVVTARTGGDVLNDEAFVRLTHPSS